MRGTHSLESQDFVEPGPRRSRLSRVRGFVVSLFAILSLVGCARTRPSGVVEETETSGSIVIAAAPDVRGLVLTEVEAFRKDYPQGTFTVREPESSAQVIAALWGGRADLAAAGRELETEEREMARRAGIEIEGHRIAQDAMCVIVASANPVHNVTVGELQRIWLGEVVDWRTLGGSSARIVPVLPPLSSDLARAFVQHILDARPMKAPSVVEASDSAVAARVAATPGAIGVVSMVHANRPGIRSLAVSPLEGLPYVEPDLPAIHEGRYPLTRTINLYIRTQGKRLAGGFVTYVSSEPGQQLVLDHGWLPTAVPIRFVHRSPLLGSH